MAASVTAQSCGALASALNTMGGMQARGARPDALRVAGLRVPAARNGKMGVRMMATQPASPSKPPGLGGTEIPLGDMITTTPIEQKGVPKADRIAYICQDCGYIYDLDVPFEEQSDETYNCPVCKAPKTRFMMENTTVGEALDVTKDGNNSVN